MRTASRAKCVTKNRYSREAIARGVGSQSAKRSGATLFPYECPDCGFWHLTRRDNGQMPITPTSSGIIASAV